MHKYLQVFKLTIKEYFTYRLNFLLWRLRVVLNFMIPLFLWSAVFDKNNSFLSYDKTTLISYLVYVTMISTFVFGTRTTDIAGDINDGRIINILVKPLPFFRFYFVRDLADKVINVLFSFFELGLLVWFFKLPLTTPTNLLLFLVVFFNGLLISFFISLSLSFMAFWTSETWAPRFIFIVLVFFLSGFYFPLDILPPFLYKILISSPFPYLFYLPAKILVSKNILGDTLLNFKIIMSFFWVFLTGKITLFIWQKGNKSFSFWGR